MEISSDGGGESEVRRTALLVAEASGALAILAGVPVAELAKARGTATATRSVEASDEAQPVNSPSPPRSVAPSPSRNAEVRAAEEPTAVSVVSAAPRLRAAAEEITSEAAVQSALRKLLAILEAARHLRPLVGLRDLVYLEDAPRHCRGRPLREKFVRGGSASL